MEFDQEQFQPLFEELGIDSPDKLKELADAAKEREALVTDREQLSKQLEELSKDKETYAEKVGKYESALNQKFATPVLQAANEKLLEGATWQDVQSLFALASVDTSQLGPEDAKVHRLMHEKGYSESDAREYLQLEYNIVGEDDRNYDEIEYKRGLLRLKDEFRDNISYLNETKTKLTKSEAQEQREAQAKELETFKSAATDYVPELKKEIVALEVPLGKDDKLNLNIRDEFKEELSSLVPQYVQQNRIDLSSDKGKGQVKEYLESMYWALYGPEIAKEIYNHAKASSARRTVLRDAQPHQPAPVLSAPGRIIFGKSKK